MCVVNRKSVNKLDLTLKQSFLILVDSELFGWRSLYQFDRLFRRDYDDQFYMLLTKIQHHEHWHFKVNIHSKQEGWQITTTFNSTSTRIRLDKWFKMSQQEPRLLSLFEWINQRYQNSGDKKPRIRSQLSFSLGKLRIWQEQTTGPTPLPTQTWPML